MKNFYSSLREDYGPVTTASQSPLLSADGTTLMSDKDKVLERWAEHFEHIMNGPSSKH